MGKRELFIIFAFVFVGAAVYRLTAPPPKPGERRISLSQIFNNVKRELSEDSTSVRITKSGELALGAAVAELRVVGLRSVPVTVIGEKRDDIGFEMTVDSSGPDEATATEWANKVQLVTDDLGPALMLKMEFPQEGTQRANVTLKVPARLAVRVENSGRIRVSEVASLELKNLSGEATISGVETITGSHRNGELTVTGAGTVNLTLVSSQTKIKQTSNGVSITARNGNCLITESAGPITVTATNVELEIHAFKNPVIKVSGDDGMVKVLNPANKLWIEGRQMAVDVDLAPGSQGEFTIITSEESLRLWAGSLDDMALDAINSNGPIRATDFGLEPVVSGREAKLHKTIGKAHAQIILRNSRGDIVIGKRK